MLPLTASSPQGLDLVIEQGQSLLIVGPSGCGKSSLLRAICGEFQRSPNQARPDFRP